MYPSRQPVIAKAYSRSLKASGSNSEDIMLFHNLQPYYEIQHNIE